MSSNKKYKAADVCRELGIQPYVLRYWETEFGPLREGRAKTTYGQRHIEVARRIKELLYDEGYTIAGAKKKLLSEVEEVGDAEKPAAKSSKSTSESSEAPESGEEPRQGLLVSEAAEGAVGASETASAGEVPAQGAEHLEAEEAGASDESDESDESIGSSGTGDGKAGDEGSDSISEENDAEPVKKTSVSASKRGGQQSPDSDPESSAEDPSAGDSSAEIDSEQSDELDSLAHQRIQTIAHGLRALRKEAEQLLKQLR